VTAEVHCDVSAFRAEVADPPTRAELRPMILALHGGYGGLRKHTERDAPVVVLRPR
jgi:hypothetical protein